MNDINNQEEWFDQHQMQPDMPLPEDAWNNMLAKLDKEMPVDGALIKAGRQNWPRNNTLYIIVLLLLALNISHTKEDFSIQQSSAHTKENNIVNATINKQQQTPDLMDESTVIANQLNNNNSQDKQAFQAKKRTNYHRIFKAAATTIYKNSNSLVTQANPFLPDSTISFINNTNTLLNKQQTAIQKTKKVAPTDSLQNEDKDEEKKLLVQAGLQWTLPMPIAGTQNYFAGPSANEQAWRVLLPGAWVSIKADKNILMAEVNPFASASFNPTSFYNDRQIDSLAILIKSKSITKVFGISGAISFQHNIAGNWWAGGGLQASFWNKGVAVLITNKHDNANNTSSTSAERYVLSKADWQYFSKFQLYPHMQVMYYHRNYEAGLRAGATFTSLAKDNGAKNLAFAQLFLRLPLISNNKK